MQYERLMKIDDWSRVIRRHDGKIDVHRAINTSGVGAASACSSAREAVGDGVAGVVLVSSPPPSFRSALPSDPAALRTDSRQSGFADNAQRRNVWEMLYRPKLRRRNSTRAYAIDESATHPIDRSILATRPPVTKVIQP